MVYVFGVLGFLGGFSLGVMLIGLFLKRVSKSELMEDKSYRWIYGTLVWIIAGIGAWAGIFVYNSYFL